MYWTTCGLRCEWLGIPEPPQQGNINCAILGSGIGGSADPRRKWKEMGERKREGEREGERKLLPLFAK